MTRCECAGLDFDQIAGIGELEGIEDFEFLCRRTGCAGTCTACRPDLQAFLATRERIAGAPAAAATRMTA